MNKSKHNRNNKYYTRNLLLLVLLVGLFLPFAADHAQAAGTYSGSCGKNLSWVNDNGTLTISGSGPMDDFGPDDAPWKSEGRVNHVRIEDGVTSIGSNAFSELSYLYDITLPESLTSIGSQAFQLCRNLKDVAFPQGLKSIGRYAFAECESLKSVELPDSLTELGAKAFSNCEDLTKVKLSKSLTEISEGLFQSCDAGIQSFIEIPSGVKTIGNHAFSGSYLAGVKLPEGLISIGDRAFELANFTSIVLPKSLETIGSRAFANTIFKSITIPKNVKNLANDSFDACASLTTIVVDAENPYYTARGGMLLSKDEKTLMAFPSARGDQVAVPDGVTEIAPHAFYASRVSKITIPRSVKKIGSGAFASCISLKVVEFGGTKEEWDQIPGVNEDYNLSHAEIAFNGIPVPKAPVLTRTYSSVTGQVKLTWDPVEGAVSYKVYRSVGNINNFTLCKETSKTSFISTIEKPGNTYFYQVKAVNSEGAAGLASDYVRSWTRLHRPTVTSGNAAKTGYPKLTWEAVAGADWYQIYRATDKDGNYKLIKTTRKLSFVNTSVQAGKKYYYYVIAGKGGSDLFNSPRSYIKSRVCDLPRPVVTLMASAGKIQGSWEAIPGATGYKLYRAEGQQGEYTLLKSFQAGDVTSFTDKDLTVGKRYYYQVKALMDGVPSASSALSTPHYRTAR